MTLLTVGIFTACEVDDIPCEEERRERVITVFENMHLDCPGDTSTAFLKAVLDGNELCYFDGLDGRYLYFRLSTKFTTPGPNYAPDDSVSDLRKAAAIRFPHEISPSIHGEDYLDIEFPDYNYETDTESYLDSLLAIDDHAIASNRDEIFKFKVRLVVPYVNLRGKHRFPHGYHFSSIYGEQDDSYLSVLSVNKRKEFGQLEYDVVFDFQCKMYYNPEYCYKYGLWSELKFGRFEGTLKVVE